MLTHLDISNYLLIRDLAIDIPAGLVVLTGETGAGKSMILGAIDVLMGKPFPKDPIRNGGTRAVIEGTFKLANSDAVRKTAGDDYFEDHDGVILLRREMAQGGKTRSFLNDQPIPQSRLAALREHLLDSHGQRENQSLYRPEKQLEFLDVFAGAVPKVQSFRELHRKRSELNRTMIELRQQYTAHMREQSLLTYQLEEIERLGLRMGEEELIEARLSKLENSEKLREQSHALHNLLIEDDHAISVRLGQARTIAMDLSKTDHDLEAFTSELKSVESQLKDLGNQIRDYCESVEMNQEELETLRARRGVLWDLKRKHGMNLDQIIARADELKRLLEEGEQLQARLQSVQAEIETVDKQIIASGTELSKIRKAAASQLSSKIEERLRPLGFAKVTFHVEVESDSPVQPETVARNGADRIHFRFSANVGTEPAELADAASGGEASRVLLAIKSVLADKIRYPLMIYDEIDLGISGQIAERVGSELANMGKRHQLIVISHLPQIASKADHHLFIEKTVSGQTTETSARFLKENERVTAIAALLAGRKITKHSLASADELLNQRKQDREKPLDKLVIHGGRQLNGEIRISGAKNATLPLMAATLLGPGIYKFTNVPGLKDVRTMSDLMRILGARVVAGPNQLTIDTSSATHNDAPYELVKTMRASFYVLGPLVARLGEARVSLPGGCAWGPRPVDLHLKGLEALGAEIQLDQGYIVARAKRLKGAVFEFPISSVGASGNIMMAAVLAKGETVLKNVALEPEITHLGYFLNSMGAKIEGIGTRELKIQGVDELHPADATMIPDRIETGSFIFGIGLTGGEVTLTNAEPSHLGAVIEVARRTGLQIETGASTIKITRGSKKPIPVTVTTEPFPGFPTDLQAPFMAQATLGEGETSITDGIFSDRFTHVAELARLGADIKMNGATAVITGVKELVGAPVMSTDLRASVCLVLAGLAARGTTEVKRIYHLDRGYEKLEEKLSRVGADIVREEGEL